MHATTLPLSSRTIENIALAYFAKQEHLHDAVRDLSNAGFDGPAINIAASSRHDQVWNSVTLNKPLENAIGGHTVRWLTDRLRAHDRHRRGADQMQGLNPLPPEGANPTCSALNLPQALRALCVPSDIIALLQLDMKHNGTFLLVDACDRVEEASDIMSANAGYLRHQYLTCTAA